MSKGVMYGSSIAEVNGIKYILVCGPKGIDYSVDLGNTWVNLDTANYWSVHIDPKKNIGWAAGKAGRFIKINFGE
jgi:hypothetical protein